MWADHSEIYGYDRLNRLVSFERGTLSARDPQNPYADPQSLMSYIGMDKPNKELWQSPTNPDDPGVGDILLCGSAVCEWRRSVGMVGIGGTR